MMEARESRGCGYPSTADQQMTAAASNAPEYPFVDPTRNQGGFVPGTQEQARPAFVYGGGVDYKIVQHVALRLEYRGFVYNRPDFGLAALSSNVTTHTAQPSAGVVISF